jgi:WD40 repeat protein
MRRLTIVLALLLGAAVAVAAGAIVIAMRKADEADAHERVLASRDLAAVAIAKADSMPELAMLLALEAYSRVDDQSAERSYDARNALLVTLERNARLKAVLSNDRGKARAVAFSPDGRLLAIGGADGEPAIWVWNLRRGVPVARPRSIHVTHHVADVAFTPDSRRLLVTGFDQGSLELLSTFNVASGRLRAKPLDITPLLGKTRDDPGRTELSDDGRFAMTHGTHDVLNVWDVSRRKPILELGGFISPVEWSLSRDGRFFAVRQYGDLSVWDLTRGTSVKAPTGNVSALAFSARGPTLAVGTKGRIILWDVVRRRPARAPLRMGQRAVRALAFSPDGRLLASAHANGQVGVWSLARPHPVFRPVRDRGEVSVLRFSPDSRTLEVVRPGGVSYVDAARRMPLLNPVRVGGVTAFSPDGTTLASIAADGVVRLWDLSREVPLDGVVFQLPNPRACCESAESLAFSPGGRTFATGGPDGKVKVWDVARGEQRGTTIGTHADTDARSVSFSPDGRRIVSVGMNDQLRVWDVARRTEVIALPRSGVGHEEDGIFEVEVAFDEAAYTPDGRLVAAAEGGKVWFWDAATFEPRPGLALVGEGIGQVVAFGPDGEMLITGGLLDAHAHLWDARRHIPVGPPLSSGEGLYDLAFSPNGKTIAGAGTDGTVRLWDVSGGTPLARPVLRGHDDIVESVAFTPDGSTLVSGGDDDTVRLWDVAHGMPLGEPLPDASFPQAVTISRDGRWLVSSHYDGTIRSWDPLLLSRDLDAWRARICRVVGRNLTRTEWHQHVGNESHRKTCPNLD